MWTSWTFSPCGQVGVILHMDKLFFSRKTNIFSNKFYLLLLGEYYTGWDVTDILVRLQIINNFNCGFSEFRILVEFKNPDNSNTYDDSHKQICSSRNTVVVYLNLMRTASQSTVCSMGRGAVQEKGYGGYKNVSQLFLLSIKLEHSHCQIFSSQS